MNSKIEKITKILSVLPPEVIDDILDALERYIESKDQNPTFNISIITDYKFKKTRSLSGGI